ncbi:MAG: hypothetical protein QOI71_3915 [Gaiellales bacterium]|nr:hypothetical protein [Gaiellales bacterium]
MHSPLPYPRVTTLAGVACLVAALEYLAHIISDRLLWLALPLGVFVLVASAIWVMTRFPSAEDTVRLQAECHDLSRALLRFLTDRKLADAASASQWHRLPHDAVASDRERAFQTRTEQILQEWQRTMAIYDRDFRAYALRLAVDAGVSRGERRWFEQPANPRGIREVAQILGYVARHNGAHGRDAGVTEPMRADQPAAPPSRSAATERAPRRSATAAQTL